jgi:hypothetical protein
MSSGHDVRSPGAEVGLVGFVGPLRLAGLAGFEVGPDRGHWVNEVSGDYHSTKDATARINLPTGAGFRERHPMDIDPEQLKWAEYWYPISWKGVLIGGLLTAVGAVATIAFLLLQWRTTNIRDEQSELRTSTLELKAADARRDTVLAQERIAKLDLQNDVLRKETAEANARALEAQVSLERFRAPRMLSERQTDQLRDAASKWTTLPSGLVLSVAVFAVDPSFEANALADQLAPVFISAGWGATRNTVMYGLSFTISGVGILTSSHPHGIAVGNAIAKALNDVGLNAFVVPQHRATPAGSTPNEVQYASNISIMIGEHPRY